MKASSSGGCGLVPVLLLAPHYEERATRVTGCKGRCTRLFTKALSRSRKGLVVCSPVPLSKSGRDRLLHPSDAAASPLASPVSSSRLVSSLVTLTTSGRDL